MISQSLQGRVPAPPAQVPVWSKGAGWQCLHRHTSAPYSGVSRSRPAAGPGVVAGGGPAHSGGQPTARTLRSEGLPKATASGASTTAQARPRWRPGWATAAGWGRPLGGMGPEQEMRRSSSVEAGGAGSAVERGATEAGVAGGAAARADAQGGSGRAQRSLPAGCGRSTWVGGRRGGGGPGRGRGRGVLRGAHVRWGVRPGPAAPYALPPRAHTHTARCCRPPSEQAVPRQALTPARPLCVPPHTRAAGHLGAPGPRRHVLGRPVQQQRVAVQRPWAGVAGGTGKRRRGCRHLVRPPGSSPRPPRPAPPRSPRR